jgi:selenocysteine-specific elongation factor
MPLTVGTAGHIDHGKTWLVRALTGKDTDRLPEERRRGISIDLGYAQLELDDGRSLSIVDVPGHERFVRTMVAGATGIDVFLLVIDAGEGARPQTREHLAILRLLGIERGVVALTKVDAVDAETAGLAAEEAAELVPGAEVVSVSAKTGAGLDELRSALGRAADEVTARRSDRSTRLYVDRSFTLKGFGTIVTGTLWSGSIGAGDELRHEPRGRDVRVRSVQVHDREVERAEAGQRVAVGLPGVERSSVRRGDALVEALAYPASYRLDVVLEELEPIADGARVQAHVGTAHVPARVARVGERFAQLRLSAPVVSARGDRVILRGETTLGGGRVLDPAPPRHRSEERMSLLESGDVARTIGAPVRVESLRHLGVLGRVARRAGSRAPGEARRRGPTRPRHRAAERSVGLRRPAPPPVRAARREALPPGRDGDSRGPRGGGDRAGARAHGCGRQGVEGRRCRARTLPRSEREPRQARRRVRDRRGRLRGREGPAHHRVPGRGRYHAGAIPRSRRHGAPRRAAPARALRR